MSCSAGDSEQIELQVDYPDKETFSVVHLTCLDGSSPVSNTVFMKDGMNLAEQVSALLEASVSP